MPSWEHGITRAIRDAIIGIIIFISISAIANILIQKLNYSRTLLPLVFKLITIVAVLEILSKIKFWSTNYIFGYLIGTLIIWSIGLLNVSEVLLYMTAGIICIIRRFVKET
jgi:hypothetical protein